MKDGLRIGIIGCGTIGGYVLDAVAAGKVNNAEVAIVCGRSELRKMARGHRCAEQIGESVCTSPYDTVGQRSNGRRK